jgi:hypothetical protein
MFTRIDGTTQQALHIGGPNGPSVNQSTDAQNAIEHRTPDATRFTVARAADPQSDDDLVTLRVLAAALKQAGLPPPPAPVSQWYVDNKQYEGLKGLYG